MKAEKKQLRVLVAPLDWGLGHATRLIPLIRHLLQRGCTVLLAGEGAVATLLQQEFPQLQLLPLAGYRVRYGQKGMAAAVLMQLPRIFRTIQQEKRWLHQLLATNAVDIVISDNRPGLYHPQYPCYYITHQLSIQTGMGAWLDALVSRLHRSYMRRFTAVWVPDVQGRHSVAGELSAPVHQLPVRYLGLLSRLEPVAAAVCYDLLLLLSGPEPQRSILEARLLKEVADFNGSVLLVRGLPGGSSPAGLPQHVTVIPHLPAHQLQEAIAQSKLVICRSGYTTIMDLLRLRAAAVLVPTPGQTEQEYLARHLAARGWFATVTQQQFRLDTALQLAASLPLQERPFSTADFEQFTQVLDEELSLAATASS